VRRGPPTMPLDPERPLAGLAVLLARPAGRAGELAALLRALGADVHVRPTIELQDPADAEPARRAVAAVGDCDWVLFTSAEGVERFAALHRRLHGRALPERPRLAAVGPATARAIARAGGAAAVVAPQATSEGLAAALARRIGAGDRVLLVRPEVARPVLGTALARIGARVEAVAFYRNVPAPGLAELVEDVGRDRFQVLVLTAPSTLEHLLAAAGEPGRGRLLAGLSRMAIVAIGTVTARAIAAAGLRAAAVAAAPGAAELAREVVSAARARMTPSIGGPLASTTHERRTPLYDVHAAEGARIVEFAGWLLPLQFSGILDEHRAVRERAGLFDVSHMGEALVRGAGALAFLQHVTCNDVSRLVPGRAQYSALLTPRGTFIDDLLVYRLDAGEYLLVLNAGNADRDVAWLAEQARAFDVEVRDVSADWSQLAVQGPRALACLEPLCSAPLASLKYYAFTRAEVAGASCVVSRTGYTGEDGFEVYAPAAAAATIWRALRAAGGAHGLVPAGLGARDTLRLEAKMALYGQDIDETTTPLEADLAWIVKLDKGPFIGREALQAELGRGVARKLVGFRVAGRAIARHGHAVFHEGRSVGQVTSGTHSPTLRSSIGLAYVPTALAQVGQALEIDVRGRREAAVVVPTPFYRRSS